MYWGMEGNGCERRVAHHPRVALYWQSTATEADEATEEVRGWAGGNCRRAKAAREPAAIASLITGLTGDGRVGQRAAERRGREARRAVVR